MSLYKESIFINVTTEPFNLHLEPTAAAINKANSTLPAGVPTTDFDGQARVQGGRADIGADEAQ